MSQPARKPSQVRIGHGGTVEIDGQNISHLIHSFTLRGNPGEQAELDLELYLDDASTMAEARVVIPHDTAALLTLLGWTPPEDSIDTTRAIAFALTDPDNREAVRSVLHREARINRAWIGALIREYARIEGIAGSRI